MEYVEKFSDYGIRKYDMVEYKLGANRIRGIIKNLAWDRIIVKPMYINEIPTEEKNQTLLKTMFDHYEMMIQDDHRGCDDSAIGLEPYCRPWREMWF